MTPVQDRKDPRITAISVAVPRHRREQESVAEFMVELHGLDGDRARWVRNLYRRSRIESRYSCIPDFGTEPRHFEMLSSNGGRDGRPGTRARMEIYEREASLLALETCRDLLGRQGSPSPTEIDHLFVVSCTGFFAPGLDVVLTRDLDLMPTVGTTLIGFQGCQAGLAALRLAEAQCRAHPESKVLIVCVELCTLHFQFEPTRDNLVANALFGDGAAAVLVEGAESPQRVPGPTFAIRRTGSYLKAGTEDRLRWSVTDEGFSLRLSSMLARRLGSDVEAFLGRSFPIPPRAGGQEAIWAVHPGGSAILDTIERSFALDPGDLLPSRSVLKKFGNMSSPTIFFVLQELLRGDHPTGPGLALAFGPGLKIEAARIDKIAT